MQTQRFVTWSYSRESRDRGHGNLEPERRLSKLLFREGRQVLSDILLLRSQVHRYDWSQCNTRNVHITLVKWRLDALHAQYGPQLRCCVIDVGIRPADWKVYRVWQCQREIANIYGSSKLVNSILNSWRVICIRGYEQSLRFYNSIRRKSQFGCQIYDANVKICLPIFCKLCRSDTKRIDKTSKRRRGKSIGSQRINVTRPNNSFHGSVWICFAIIPKTACQIAQLCQFAINFLFFAFSRGNDKKCKPSSMRTLPIKFRATKIQQDLLRSNFATSTWIGPMHFHSAAGIYLDLAW